MKTEIPTGYVEVTRNSNTYVRSRNGAWMAGRANPPDVRVVLEADAIKFLSGEFVTLAWPDGYCESFDLAVTPIRFSHWGPNAKTETVNSDTLTNGKPDWSFEKPLSRLGKVGYYRVEALPRPADQHLAQRAAPDAALSQSRADRQQSDLG